MMGCGMELRIEQKQKLKLSQKQWLKLENILFYRRSKLIGKLYGEVYKPEAKCPMCERKMSPAEIIRGFTRDPKDTTTKCRRCGTRFQPMLMLAGRSVSVEGGVAFYCSVQVLDKLRGLEKLRPKKLSHLHPAVYQSAIVHHGSVAGAFKKLGVEYPFAEVADWRKKVKPFLGKLSDVFIANCANVSVNVIRKMRKDAGISRYTARKFAEDAGMI